MVVPDAKSAEGAVPAATRADIVDAARRGSPTRNTHRRVRAGPAGNERSPGSHAVEILAVAEIARRKGKRLCDDTRLWRHEPNDHKNGCSPERAINF